MSPQGALIYILKKTSDHLTIPIIGDAQKIIDKYADYQSEDGSLFPVPSAQKLNDYIKLAAKGADLDREVINTYYIGTKRYDEVNKSMTLSAVMMAAGPLCAARWLSAFQLRW